jgi:hypothetical protein
MIKNINDKINVAIDDSTGKISHILSRPLGVNEVRYKKIIEDIFHTKK